MQARNKGRETAMEVFYTIITFGKDLEILASFPLYNVPDEEAARFCFETQRKVAKFGYPSAVGIALEKEDGETDEFNEFIEIKHL